MADALRPGRFWLPGPTEVAAEVLQAQVRPMIGHRGAAAEALMRRVQPGLREVFGTSRPVVILAASATALMEAGVRGAVGRRLLAVVNGAFSERFAEIARACDLPMDTLEVPWGCVVDPDEVRGRLAGGRYDAVTVVHSETSTGALTDIEAVGAAVAEFDGVQLVVDSVTGAGGAPVRADEWGLDMVLTGSQKALALPPGLAFATLSPRLVKRGAGLPGRGLYLDVVAMVRYLERDQVPTTPALTLMYALEAQLERIASEGLEARFARHSDMAARCHAWVDGFRNDRGIDIGVLAPEGARSPTVTCIRLPSELSAPDVVRRVREAGWVIGGGYGRLKESTIRIGHMGDHRPEGLEVLLGVVGEALVAAAGR